MFSGILLEFFITSRYRCLQVFFLVSETKAMIKHQKWTQGKILSLRQIILQQTNKKAEEWPRSLFPHRWTFCPLVLLAIRKEAGSYSDTVHLHVSWGNFLFLLFVSRVVFIYFGEMALIFSSHHIVSLGISQSSFQIHMVHMIGFRCRNCHVGIMSGKQNSGRV